MYVCWPYLRTLVWCWCKLANCSQWSYISCCCIFSQWCQLTNVSDVRHRQWSVLSVVSVILLAVAIVAGRRINVVAMIATHTIQYRTPQYWNLAVDVYMLLVLRKTFSKFTRLMHIYIEVHSDTVVVAIIS